MRWVHIAIVVLFAAGTLIFLVQNREIVSMDFLGFSVRAPLAVIAASFYLLGAITGSSPMLCSGDPYKGPARRLRGASDPPFPIASPLDAQGASKESRRSAFSGGALRRTRRAQLRSE